MTFAPDQAEFDVVTLNLIKDLREQLAMAQVVIDGVGEMYADYDLGSTISKAYVAYRNKYG